MEAVSKYIREVVESPCGVCGGTGKRHKTVMVPNPDWVEKVDTEQPLRRRRWRVLKRFGLPNASYGLRQHLIPKSANAPLGSLNEAVILASIDAATHHGWTNDIERLHEWARKTSRKTRLKHMRWWLCWGCSKRLKESEMNKSEASFCAECWREYREEQKLQW